MLESEANMREYKAINVIEDIAKVTPSKRAMYVIGAIGCHAIAHGSEYVTETYLQRLFRRSFDPLWSAHGGRDTARALLPWVRGGERWADDCADCKPGSVGFDETSHYRCMG